MSLRSFLSSPRHPCTYSWRGLFPNKFHADHTSYKLYYVNYKIFR